MQNVLQRKRMFAKIGTTKGVSFMGKKKIIIWVILVFVFLLGLASFYGYKEYQEKKEIERQEKLIENNLNHIEQVASTFESEKNYDKKLEYLKNAINEQEKYSKSKEVFKEVVDKWRVCVAGMKKYFNENYDTIISENTISKINETKDKNVIQNAIDNLSNLSDVLDAEGDFTCEEDKLHNLHERIDGLLVSYNQQLEQIKADEEAAKKAEEERLAKEKAEAEKKKKENKNKNKSSSNSNNTSNSNGRKKYSSYEEVDKLIKNGTITNYSCWEWVGADGVQYKRYIVDDYSYCSDGQIIDYLDPKYGDVFDF